MFNRLRKAKQRLEFDSDGSSPGADLSNAISGKRVNFPLSKMDLVERSTRAEAMKLPNPLSYFDACVEAADAIAAEDAGRRTGSPTAAETSPSTALSTNAPEVQDRDRHGVSDCSVMVSPDGSLLFLPENQKLAERENGAGSSLQNLYPLEDVNSAITAGSDLVAGGDRASNGFSTRGWSPHGASLALRRSETALRSTNTFLVAVFETRRREAQVVSGALSRQFRENVISSLDDDSSTSEKVRRKIEKVRDSGIASQEGNEADFDLLSASFSRDNKLKTSPLFFPGSTMHAAAMSLLQYHAQNYSNDLERNGEVEADLASLQNAADRTSRRTVDRDTALHNAQKHVAEAEAVLSIRRAESARRWEELHKTEQTAQTLFEEKTRERSKILYQNKVAKEEEERRRKRVNADLEQLDSGVMQAEVWELISQLGSEESSFSPIGIPEGSAARPNEKSLVDDEFDEDECNEGEASSHIRSSTSDIAKLSRIGSRSGSGLGSRPVPPPKVDKSDIEIELHIPSLRARALEADDNVEDASTSLLNAISNLDTTYRSARLAAESALLASANAQAQCLANFTKQERLHLESKLKTLAVLERQICSLDVRADLDAFIEFDKRERRGGSTRLGEDDDGGIASALAVLDGHAHETNSRLSSGERSISTYEGWGRNDSADNPEDENEKKLLTCNEVDKLITVFFKTNSTKEDKAILENAVKELSEAGTLSSSSGRSCRASICSSLNKQRGDQTELGGVAEFDGLCRVFVALLSACDTSAAGDVASAKLCMMLSQTFFVEGGEEQNDEVGESDDRTNRIYVKSRLVNHPLLFNEDFWVQALFQCVNESLSGSGVISSNFDKSRLAHSSSSVSLSKTKKWFELSPDERFEAASQVHAVIFAQLMALSHSRIEFGCSIKDACAFVRRLSIQHQLPLSQRSRLIQHLLDRHEQRSDNGNASDPLAKSSGKAINLNQPNLLR